MTISKNKRVIITYSSKQTQKFGQLLAKNLRQGDIVCLVGDLGAGKTCLVQGIAVGLAVKDRVNSPTFKLINEYKGKFPIYHFDLYRLDNFLEIKGLGYEEFLFGQGVTLIEWAEKIIPYLPENYIRIDLERKNQATRKITLTDKRKGLNKCGY